MARIQTNPLLTGSPIAVESNGVLQVSPAMWDLLSHEEGDSLEHVLKNIKVLHLDTLATPSIPTLEMPSEAEQRLTALRVRMRYGSELWK